MWPQLTGAGGSLIRFVLILISSNEGDEAASADLVAARIFTETLREILGEGVYLPKQVFHVDETGLYWKRMPDRSYITKEEKLMPGYNIAKDRLTVLFGDNASSDMKLKPLLVYYSEKPRALKKHSQGLSSSCVEG